MYRKNEFENRRRRRRHRCCRETLIKNRWHFMDTIVHGIKYAMQETTL